MGIEQVILTWLFAYVMNNLPEPERVPCPTYCKVDHDCAMRVYKVNRVEHKVYDSDDSLPDSMIVHTNWREGQVGDWVRADDDCIVQILRRGLMKNTKGKNRDNGYVGTCAGTFPLSFKSMDTSRRNNIYSFGGSKSVEEVLQDRINLNKNEMLFVMYLSQKMPAREAYLKAFPTNNPYYANLKAGHLIKTERGRTAMREEIKPVLEELNLDERFVLKKIKEVISTSDKDETRLKALFKLADIMDLEDKNSTKITQVSGALFQGFSKDMVEAAERPKEIE